MKRITLMVAATFVALSACALKRDPEYLSARRNGAEMKMVLRVSDDEGLAVSNAAVRVLMGMNFRERCYFIEGQTDTNGLFVIAGKTAGDEVVVDIEKDGYYKTHKKYCFATMGAEHEVKDGKWQPYENCEDILLRKSRNPMVRTKSYALDFRYVKVLHEWIGFDLEKNAFVKPFGVGETADFEVMFDWDGKWLPDYTGMGVKVRFAPPLSGYYAVKVKKESKFIGPYEASPEVPLVHTAEFSEKIMPDKSRRHVHFDDTTCWVVRSRCRMDEKGNLVSANYSVIYGIEFTCERGGLAGLRVNGILNPTPNDTNLEAKQ